MKICRAAVAALRLTGCEICSVYEQGIVGISDEALLQRCTSEQRALVTLDMDFAQIHRYPPDQFAGIVVLRLKKLDAESVTRNV